MELRDRGLKKAVMPNSMATHYIEMDTNNMRKSGSEPSSRFAQKIRWLSPGVEGMDP